MADLIDRQAAIDAFYKYPNIDWTTLDVLAKINALPSTQTEIIRCKDCKYHDENKILDSSNSKIGWHPCDTVMTNNNWFCGNAERRTDGKAY